MVLLLAVVGVVDASSPLSMPFCVSGRSGGGWLPHAVSAPIHTIVTDSNTIQNKLPWHHLDRFLSIDMTPPTIYELDESAKDALSSSL